MDTRKPAYKQITALIPTDSYVTDSFWNVDTLTSPTPIRTNIPPYRGSQLGIRTLTETNTPIRANIPPYRGSQLGASMRTPTKTTETRTSTQTPIETTPAETRTIIIGRSTPKKIVRKSTPSHPDNPARSTADVLAEIKKLGYKLVDITGATLGLHIKYYRKDDDSKTLRIGGFLKHIDDKDRYVILTNGKSDWSVQVKDNIFFIKVGKGIKMGKALKQKLLIQEQNNIIQEKEKLIADKDEKLNKYRTKIFSLKKERDNPS
jgi:hypothetical protein